LARRRRRLEVEARSEAPSLCPSCRANVTSSQNFCSSCGAALHAPDTDVPEHLQARSHNARATLEAENKIVTMLFADVVGSTTLIRDMEAEQAGAILDPVLQGMVRAVHDHGGVVNRIQGDGIMALFGAPLAQEEHAASACRAALDIRTLATDPRLTVRVGLHSGEVALRVIRNAGFVEYDAMGVHVHIAARMEQTAAPRTIQVSLATSRLLREQFSLRPLGSLPIKGGPEGGIVAFELIGEADARGRRTMSTGHDRSPFVNRTVEMLTLKAAAAGDGRVITISGHAGTGKSRLVREFAAGLETSGWHVLEASAAGEERTASYRPFMQLIGDCLGADLYGPQEPIARQLERALTAAGPHLMALQSPLLALIGAPVDDPEWSGMTPTVRQRRIVEAVGLLIDHTAARRRLLLLVEDAHFFDRQSEELLDYLVERLSKQNGMIVATCRPAYRDHWKRIAGYRRIKVEPLTEPDCRRLLDEKLGRDPSLAAIKTQLIARTQGVPLFVEEMVKTLSETAFFDGVGGNYRTTAAAVEINIPDSVRPVLAARIDRLPAVPKEILQIAAAIGVEFDLAVLAGARGSSEAELQTHLDVLEEGDFIIARRGKAAGRFAFRHVLIQEVAYRSLLSARRQQIHTAVVEAMERLYPQRLKEEAEALARHCLEGKLWDRAVVHLKAATLKAIEYAAHPQAIRWVDLALEAIQHIPERGRAMIETEIEFRLLLRESLGALGQYDRWKANMDAAEKLAAELGDQARILAIRVARLHLHNVLTDIRGAIAASRETRKMALAQGNAQHVVAAAYFQSQAHNWHGEYRAAITSLQDAQPMLHGLPRDARCGMTGTARGMYYAQLAASHAWLGEFAEAVQHGRTASRLADVTKRDFDRAVASFGYGSTLVLKGVFDRAVTVLEKGLAATERAEIPLLYASLAGPLSYALLKQGDTKRAQVLTEQLLARPEISAYSRAWALFYRAHVCLETGDEDAADLAEEALLRAREGGYQAMEAACHLTLSRVRQASDAPRARRHLATAGTMAAKLHLAPLQAHCLAETARFTAAARPREAGLAAAAAERQYRSLGMKFSPVAAPIARAKTRARAASPPPTRKPKEGGHRDDAAGNR
jgi:class 3 adenylate cyclase